MTNVEFWGMDFDGDRRPGAFDAVFDMAATQYARDVGALFRRLREALTEDGIVVSVPMLGRVREIEALLATPAHADLRLRGFEWVHARDLGRNLARPALVLARTGEAIQVDVRREMDAAKSRLAGSRITPLFELAESEPGMMV